MPYFSITSAIVLHISGVHAVRYLNARLSNDILKLPVGAGCLGAALTPQGKTEGLFSVYKMAENRALLVCDAGDREKVIAAFRRYIVADRVEVKDESDDWKLFHIFAEKDLSRKFGFAPGAKNNFENISLSEKKIIASRKRTSEIGWDILVSGSANEDLKEFLAGASLLDSQEAKLQRIKAGLAAFPDELEDRLFLEAEMSEAISYTKGCYTGQEVVERIASQGKAPKVIKMARFEVASTSIIGEKVISSEGSVIGEVLSEIYDPQSAALYCMVSIKNDPKFFSADIAVKEIAGQIF